MDASVADYAEHLTETDLRLLSDVVPVAGGATAALARDPVTIERLLADPRVFEAVFGPDGVAAGHAVLVSPFLAFGVAVHRAAAHALGPLDAGRLLRSARVPAAERDGLAAAPALELLEYLGARWYRAALAAAPVRTANLAVVGEVAARFHQARRILNHVADRYLLSPGGPWFTPPGPG